MPTLVGLVVASLVGWGVDQLLGSAMGPWSLIVSLTISSIAFYFGRAWLTRLRDG